MSRLKFFFGIMVFVWQIGLGADSGHTNAPISAIKIPGGHVDLGATPDLERDRSKLLSIFDALDGKPNGRLSPFLARSIFAAGISTEDGLKIYDELEGVGNQQDRLDLAEGRILSGKSLADARAVYDAIKNDLGGISEAQVGGLARAILVSGMPLPKAKDVIQKLTHSEGISADDGFILAQGLIMTGKDSHKDIDDALGIYTSLGQASGLSHSEIPYLARACAWSHLPRREALHLYLALQGAPGTSRSDDIPLGEAMIWAQAKKK